MTTPDKMAAGSGLAVGFMGLLLLGIVPFHGVIASECPSVADVFSCPTDPGDKLAADFLQKLEGNMSQFQQNIAEANFQWSTNITKENEARKTKAWLTMAHYMQNAGKYAYEHFKLDNISNEKIRRAMEDVMDSRPVLRNEDLQKYMELSNTMVGIYSTATICPADMSENCKKEDRLKLEPDLVRLMRQSRNSTELAIIWKRWRDASGKKIKDLFFEHNKYNTLYANRMGFERFSDKILNGYERDDPHFRDELDKIFLAILPFYEDLHAYVRNKLRNFYGPDVVPDNSTIPAHIFGNMWTQEWINIYPIVKPYPDASAPPSITQMMKNENWAVADIFNIAEDFFVSIGFPPLPAAFWEKSMFTQPTERDVVCHASAWDMGDYDDVRIKMCTEVNREYLGVVHHEMGHIYYYLAYQNLSAYFRSGANQGFHEAVGDTVFLSSNQDSYLKHLRLLPQDFERTEETRINQLMSKALFAVTFIPYGFAVEKWRWAIYDGKIAKKDANRKWWEHRKKYQGLHSPVPRSDDDFDPGCKFHVASGTSYIRYFVARFLQYQFHDALCQNPGESVNISTCSIFGNKESGSRLWDMLKLGKSEPWPDALEKLTGERELSADSLLKFYEPLRRWLRQENEKSGVCLGWGQEWPAEAKLNGPRC